VTQVLRQLADGHAQLVGRPDRAESLVLAQLEHAERGHEAVAVALADAGAATAEDPADGLAVAVDDPLGDQRLELMAQNRRADHVTEQHGDDPELPRRDGTGKRRSASRARLARLADNLAASRACRHVVEYMGRAARRKSPMRQIPQQPGVAPERLAR
jgi:hypothetical protein